jgi:hypothetical protein
LAGIALELGALAFIGYVLMDRENERRGVSLRYRSAAEESRPAPQPAPEPAAQTPAADSAPPQPVDFIAEPDDVGARYYRAVSEDAELLAGFYSDGRIRLADAQNHRFAGLVQAGHADLLELDNNQWSEVFVRSAPDGTMQLELRGGPYDARVLTCEPFDKLRMTR